VIAGWLALEWIDGCTVRVCLDERLKSREQDGIENPAEGDEQLVELMRKVGNAVGGLHKAGIIHGDLTTSNLMLQKPKSGTAGDLDGEIVLIDFGLATQSVQDEDRAVDLYVLERAFGSTHPQAESLFQEVLRTYAKSYSSGKVVLKRLEEVRMRGRKKSMIG